MRSASLCCSYSYNHVPTLLGPDKAPQLSCCTGARLTSHLEVALVALHVVLPEFDIAVLAEGALLDELALLAHEVLDGNVALAKDLEVVADDVAVAAAGTGDEDGAAVVALLGDVVGGLGVARRAGEGEAVVRLGLDARLGRVFGRAVAERDAILMRLSRGRAQSEVSLCQRSRLYRCVFDDSGSD
ncbi:hypothetical protein HYQ46_011828 [Verticillium longisporum]|nr:hypothetical protein HYQ46_011828 [Verticillium longisporum]